MTAYGSQIITGSPTVNPSLMEPGEKWTFNIPVISGVEVSEQTYLNTDCTVALIATENGDVQPTQMNESNGEANTHQQNIADAQNQLQNDVSTLNQDVSGISGDVGKIAGDVSQTDNDLSQTRTDAANGDGDECLNASTTVYNDAATTVYNDVLTTAYNDVGTVATDIAAIQKHIASIQADQAALQNLGQSPGGADAISSAQASISSAISAVNPPIAHLNSDLSAAYAVADSVGTGSCAGDGPGNAPTGLSPLK
jgi:septal ring factor EnvC (AmiA/AmiB activator)